MIPNRVVNATRSKLLDSATSLRHKSKATPEIVTLGTTVVASQDQVQNSISSASAFCGIGQDTTIKEYRAPVPPINQISFISQMMRTCSLKTRDKNILQAKIEEICLHGLDELVVITDFDHTLSRYVSSNGTICTTTHGVFDEMCDKTNISLGNQLHKTQKNYREIEFDPHLSVDEKIPHMIEWWEISHDIIIAAKFNKSQIYNCVLNSNIELREGAVEWLKFLSDRGVPIVVFSAGITDVIINKFQQEFCNGIIPSNIHVIGNSLVYDKTDTAVAFAPPLIHTFSKNSTVLLNHPEFYNQFCSRRNVLLLGDSLGDANMDLGVKHAGCTLRLAFLNHSNPLLQRKYLNMYDAMLVNDETMQFAELLTKAASGRL